MGLNFDALQRAGSSNEQGGVVIKGILDSLDTGDVCIVKTEVKVTTEYPHTKVVMAFTGRKNYREEPMGDLGLMECYMEMQHTITWSIPTTEYNAFPLMKIVQLIRLAVEKELALAEKPHDYNQSA